MVCAAAGAPGVVSRCAPIPPPGAPATAQTMREWAAQGPKPSPRSANTHPAGVGEAPRQEAERRD
jgi:hypothetical protein